MTLPVEDVSHTSWNGGGTNPCSALGAAKEESPAAPVAGTAEVTLPVRPKLPRGLSPWISGSVGATKEESQQHPPLISQR